MLKQLFSFHGRIRRSQWWLGQLCAIGVAFGVFIVAGVIFALTNSEPVPVASTDNLPPGLIALTLLYPVLMVLVGWIQLATNAKRFHDRDKSGWWILIGFIPFVGFWVLIECGFLDSKPGVNAHGTSAKYPADAQLANVFS